MGCKSFPTLVEGFLVPLFDDAFLKCLRSVPVQCSAVKVYMLSEMQSI